MPPRKTSGGIQRQLSLETVSGISDSSLDSDGDGEFDPVQAAVELKRAIDKHKKRRFEMRKKIEKKYEAKVVDIVQRTEARLAERDTALARTRQEQLAQLITAVEARDAKQRAVADKVGRFYDSCVNLTNLLQTAYAGLADEARAAALEDEDAKIGAEKSGSGILASSDGSFSAGHVMRPSPASR